MYTVTIVMETESSDDVEAMKRALQEAEENGEINTAFSVKVDEE